MKEREREEGEGEREEDEGDGQLLERVRFRCAMDGGCL